MKTSLALLAAGLIVSGCTLAPPDAKSSLNERRQGVIQGTAPGIDLLAPLRGAVPSPKAAPAQAATTPQPTAARQTVSAAQPVAQASAPQSAPQGVAVQRWIQPPSGQTLGEARRLDSPSIGTALPTAGTATRAAEGTRSRD